jgi:hypothetical protein
MVYKHWLSREGWNAKRLTSNILARQAGSVRLFFDTAALTEPCQFLLPQIPDATDNQGARKIQMTTNYSGRPPPTDSLKALGKTLVDHL